MFPAMLYSLLAVTLLVALLQHSLRKLFLVSLGILGGLMAWNSQDFGLAVALSFGIVLQIATRGSFRKSATMFWLGGFIPGLMLYPLWTVVIGDPIKLKYLALTALSFAGGAASSPIQIPGPVLLVMPVIFGSVAVGVSLVWKTSEGTRGRPTHRDYAVATLAFVGTWMTISLPYYINRSYASGQLQIFLLPVGVCCCALLSLCQTAEVSTARQAGSGLMVFLKTKALWLLPVTLPIAVGLGAILQSPSPSISVDALAHPSVSSGFLGSVSARDVLLAMAYAREHGGGSVGYVGPDASYLKLLTGVQPRILYDDPADFSLSSATLKLGCEFVRHDRTRWLTVGEPSVVPPSLIGAKRCGNYEPVVISGEPPNTIFKLRSGLPARAR